jgi:long-chain acyl-CoA synthetase
LHTGDIGVLEDDIFLTITDRKKEIFKNSAGKYIAPQVIENIMKESSLIEQAMVVGENEKFASALISPNLDYLHFWAGKHKVHFNDNKDLVQKKEVIARMQKEINKVNKRLGQVEQIKRFRLVCDAWSPETGELSPTLKLKRKELYTKYEHILKDIYSVG